jgi:lactate 2-monooxygenase
MAFMERQNEIYQKGLFGQKPAQPIDLEALEMKAKEILKPEAYDYVAGGAGLGSTVRANSDAFEYWRIMPRMLRDVSKRDTSVEVLGMKLPVPVMIAPVGVQSIIHPDGELAVARAAASLNIPMVLSTLSSYSMEQVAQSMGDASRWFQLYWSKDFDIVTSFIKRAEAAGYGAIVVTLDTAMLGWRDRDLQHAYLPFLQGEGLANYFTDPVFRAQLASPPEEDPGAAIMRFVQVFGNPALTWESLAFLRKQTKLPILLKGILHPDDAVQAVDEGIDGIIVSNHGGRQVDGAIAALDALVMIAEAIDDEIPLLLDSGVRRSADVFKAVALGAQAVLYGRPVMWGLAVNGEEGVRDVLLNLLAEIDLTLGLSGYTSFDQLDMDALIPLG